MNHLLKLLCFCLWTTIGWSQQLNFPVDYFGIYKGTLEISSLRGGQKLPMEFHLLPTDSIGKYKYILVYGEKEQRQERSYFLIEEDPSKGQYMIDEDNGILLSATYFDSTLYCLFEVAENLLTTFITFHENSLVFEIVVGNTQLVKETKDDEEGIAVKSYPIFTRQRAMLIKQ